MNLISALSIGAWYQNASFYSVLILLVCLNFDLLKYCSKRKELNSSLSDS